MFRAKQETSVVDGVTETYKVDIHNMEYFIYSDYYLLVYPIGI